MSQSLQNLLKIYDNIQRVLKNSLPQVLLDVAILIQSYKDPRKFLSLLYDPKMPLSLAKARISKIWHITSFPSSFRRSLFPYIHHFHLILPSQYSFPQVQPWLESRRRPTRANPLIKESVGGQVLTKNTIRGLSEIRKITHHQTLIIKCLSSTTSLLDKEILPGKVVDHSFLKSIMLSLLGQLRVIGQAKFLKQSGGQCEYIVQKFYAHLCSTSLEFQSPTHSQLSFAVKTLHIDKITISNYISIPIRGLCSCRRARAVR